MSLEDKFRWLDISINPIEEAYRDPRACKLKKVPKANQTPQVVEFVVSNDGTALAYVSKKLITDSLCKMAIQQNGLALEYVPVNYITAEICDLAVSENGLAIKYVPEKFITSVLAYKAVRFYYLPTFHYPGYTPKVRTDDIEQGRKQGARLGESCKYPISYVPLSLLTEQLIFEAVKYSPNSLRDVPQRMITKEIALTAVTIDGMALCYIPKNVISNKMIEVAITNNALALEFVPQRKITEDMCRKCFEKNPLAIRCIPNEYLTEALCVNAFKRNLDSFKYIPDEYKTLEMCVEVIKQDNFGFEKKNRYDESALLFDYFPEKMRNNKIIIDSVIEKYENGAHDLFCWNEQTIKRNEYQSTVVVAPLCKEMVEYLKEKIACFDVEKQAKASQELNLLELQITDTASLEVSLEPLQANSLPVEYESNESVIHNLADKDGSARTIYYISDIHLEHQLKPIIEKIRRERTIDNEDDFQAAVFSAVDSFLDEKVQKLVLSAKNKEDILLIGGDVAISRKLAILFYKKLSLCWDGHILIILGNHELWDGHSEVVKNARTVDEIVDGYRDRIHDQNVPLSEQIFSVDVLENDIFLIYKNSRLGERVIREEEILNANNKDLADVCSKASIIVLGGVGFSGLNPYYNAERGLYRGTVTSMKDDKELSERFYKVYKKLNQCAESKQVIVLTHTPVHDWLDEPCNANWIYVNGHTHQNTLTREINGAIILSDNQIGYKPQTWKLNAFTVSGWYDPFEKFDNGIYEISSQKYKDFNVGRGIYIKGCNYPGKIYALKRDGLYMFLLETGSSLCLLVGGQRKKLQYQDVNYYYDKMSLYGQIVREAIKPYQQFLETISREVKNFGGTGSIHGCIVDISWFSHIYVNPFDGKVTSYWALDMRSKLSFKNIQMLLEEKEPLLFERFILEQKKKALPIIDKYLTKKSCKAEAAVVPEWVYETEMYIPSRTMKSVQYIWSQNVIREWNDEILNKYFTDRVIEDKEANFLT